MVINKVIVTNTKIPDTPDIKNSSKAFGTGEGCPVAKYDFD